MLEKCYSCMKRSDMKHYHIIYILITVVACILLTNYILKLLPPLYTKLLTIQLFTADLESN